MRRLLLLLVFLLPACAFGRGIAFDEEMHGYALWQGEFRYTDVYFHIVVADIDRWRADQNYAATVTGTLYLERVPAQTVAGTLQILAPAPGDDGRLLTYRFASPSIRFAGLKHVRNDGGFDLVDDMTTLRGVFLPAGQTPPTIAELLYGSLWTAEIHFEWWDAGNLWTFVNSFHTVNTPWYQEITVRVLFLDTVLGDLAREWFPWLY